MRIATYTKALYTFDELSEEAKQHAIEKEIENCGYAYNDDYRNTLNAFCDLFGVKIGIWEIGTYGGYSFSVSDYGRGNIAECENYRLSKYLTNNNLYLYKWDKKYHDLKFFTEHCGLTGYCADYIILLPMLECQQYKRIFSSYEEMIDCCLDEFFCAWLEDMKYQETPEYFAELAAANDWEFDEGGNIA